MRDGMRVEVVPGAAPQMQMGRITRGDEFSGRGSAPILATMDGVQGAMALLAGRGGLLCHPIPRAQCCSAALPSTAPHVPAPQAHTADHLRRPHPSAGRWCRAKPPRSRQPPSFLSLSPLGIQLAGRHLYIYRRSSFLRRFIQERIPQPPGRGSVPGDTVWLCLSFPICTSWRFGNSFPRVFKIYSWKALGVIIKTIFSVVNGLLM